MTFLRPRDMVNSAFFKHFHQSHCLQPIGFQTILFDFETFFNLRTARSESPNHLQHGELAIVSLPIFLLREQLIGAEYSATLFVQSNTNLNENETTSPSGDRKRITTPVFS
uniref:Orf110a n=1 Tax=Batis maritima TaxID=4436 RepID=A0A068BD05_BATMA|nr:orf110a [Batis maritima]AIC83327.1 orf110a [Batis maritima]